MRHGVGKHHHADSLQSEQAPGVSQSCIVQELGAPLYKQTEGTSGGPRSSDSTYSKRPNQAELKGDLLPP